MSKVIFSRDKVINSALSPFEQYCTGYPGKGSYITALTMEIGSFKKTFSHAGSKRLDSIVSYDRAEARGPYIGQINMSLVSSFCGPQGLIWGYDIVKEESEPLPSFLSIKKIKEFEGIKIRNGKNLRKAAEGLFGNKEKKHFPFLPGTHVPCAGKFKYKLGPTFLYGAIAIGIPKNRNKSACLFMEDVGEIPKDKAVNSFKEKIYLDGIRSVLEIGKNQGVKYVEIFIDLVSEKISRDKMCCVLVTIPYFLLAKKAITKDLAKQNLSEWTKKTKKYFLSSHF